MNIPILSELRGSYIHAFPKNLKTFLVTKALAYTQSAFAKCLINVYFWRVTSDIHLLVLFNVLYALAHAFIYIPAAKYAKEKNPLLPLRAATVAQLIYLGAIMAAGDQISFWIVPVAIIGGIANGAYWLGDNMLKFDLTTPDNRFQFTAAFQAAKNLVGMAIPPIAAVMVTTATGVSGYANLFGIAMICSICVLISTFLISDQVTHVAAVFRWHHIRTLFADKNIRRTYLSTYLGEIPSILPILLALLVFKQTGGELAIGGYQLFTSIAVVAGNYYAGKHVSRANYKWVLTVGGIINFACIAILVVDHQFIGILVFGIATSLVSCVTSISSAIGYDAFSYHCTSAEERTEKRLEYLAFKEMCDAAGKITGFCLLLLVGSAFSIELTGLVVVICAIAELMSNLIIAQVREVNIAAVTVS